MNSQTANCENTKRFQGKMNVDECSHFVSLIIILVIIIIIIVI